MKKTGIFRRIDELGRVVIPKEIRRMLSIRDGESLEILVDGETIVLKKFHPLSNVQEIAEKLIDIYKTLNDSLILITDREKVIASSREEFINHKIDLNLENLIQARQSIANQKLNYNLGGIDMTGIYSICPIITEIDCVGLVIVFKDQLVNSIDNMNTARLFSKILSEKLNIC